ncbi:helix-hairpin-helix domain-containing protein [Mameliella sp. AT18]|uniref:helix-hairpin-helix domain-containing protein n=1 Tax=Mameliella sp. AT18 TaxID=3028385 RepID=UPI00237A6BD5|nr:helix-hairpin-helix domain-containing protein [Mameliella sp. AT18]MDD9731286.1 helix-hairpin-helix domain-containing protein [Mameliella sp. AT18]
MPDPDRRPAPATLENAPIAARLREYADLLETQGEDGFRVRAYHDAAHEIDGLTQSLAEVFHDGGLDALIRLRGIGRGVAATIAEMLTTGCRSQLEWLRGTATPEATFRTIPGIGPELARRLAETLEVETHEELETALRLGDTQVPGIGDRRRQAILSALGQRMAGMRRISRPAGPETEPPVALLLEADALYRTRAAAGDLRTIAPRRFNPTGEAWLPILHARRGSWHLTLMFSNTARAHELDRTHD